MPVRLIANYNAALIGAEGIVGRTGRRNGLTTDNALDLCRRRRTLRRRNNTPRFPIDRKLPSLCHLL